MQLSKNGKLWNHLGNGKDSEQPSEQLPDYSFCFFKVDVNRRQAFWVFFDLQSARFGPAIRALTPSVPHLAGGVR